MNRHQPYRPKNPRLGISPAHATAPGYGYASPDGEGGPTPLYIHSTLYIAPKGYTKHYYAESERVASRIGGGGLGDITRTIMNMEDLLTDFWVGEDGLLWEEVWGSEFYETKHEEFRNHLTDVMTCAGADPIVEDNRLVELRTYWQYIQDEGEQECYWYHPDHLGSSSWITFSDGEAIQHLHYLPWGENFVDQRSTTWNAMYTFSAKEKDAETGYSYFGARYYSSDLSIWLSVDPMSDKYPHQSNYVYCSNNPIKIFDPNGEDEWEVNESTGVIKHYSNDKPDKLYVTSQDGTRKDNVAPLEVDRTIMGSMTSDGSQTSFHTMDKRDEMNKMFDYLADNTNVEWTHIGASFDIETSSGIETKNDDMLFTRHQNTSCNMKGSLQDFASNGRLDFHKHSHPNKYTGNNPYYALMYPTTSHIPSRSDVKSKNNYVKTDIPLKQPVFLLRNGKKNIYY